MLGAFEIAGAQLHRRSGLELGLRVRFVILDGLGLHLVQADALLKPAPVGAGVERAAALDGAKPSARLVRRIVTLGRPRGPVGATGKEKKSEKERKRQAHG